MRILMISDVYFPRINGVSTSIQTFKQELESLGHEVFLLVPDYPVPYSVEPSIFRISSRGVVLDPEDRMMRYRKIIEKIPALRDLALDIVHIHTPFVAHYAGLRIARELGVSCVCTYHTLFEEYLYHYIPWLPRGFLRFCARRFSVMQCNQVDGVIAPSSVIVRLLQEYGVEQSIVTLPTGINAAHFARGDGYGFRRRLGISTSAKVLLNVSRVAFEKNIGLLIDMFADLQRQQPDSHLVIAGEGPARETYMVRAKALQLEHKISFVGYLDRQSELVDCYHAADVFVFASATETQGLVLLEAMAAGVPVVSVAAMGTKDVLVEGQGVNITDGTLQDFSAKALALLNATERHARLSVSALHYAKTWDSHQCAQKLLAYYEEFSAPSALPGESPA